MVLARLLTYCYNPTNITDLSAHETPVNTPLITFSAIVGAFKDLIRRTGYEPAEKPALFILISPGKLFKEVDADSEMVGPEAS